MKSGEELHDLKHSFDNKIKEMLLSGEESVFAGFARPNGSNFGRVLPKFGYRSTYFDDKEFGKALLNSVKDILPETYKGDELKYKFFSVASSSRFTIASFSEKNDEGSYKKIASAGNLKFSNVEFEKSCPVIIDGKELQNPPQLDAAFTDENGENWYIEAKCHEIFDDTEHIFLELKAKYRLLIETCIKPYLRTYKILDTTLLLKDKDFRSTYLHEFLIAQEKNSVRMLKSEDFGVERESAHFDFKQFLCHLMGIISTEYNVPKENRKLKHFYYLFYKIRAPEFDWIYKELEKEISAVNEVFKPIFEEYKIDFGYCYNERFSSLQSLENVLKKDRQDS